MQTAEVCWCSEWNSQGLRGATWALVGKTLNEASEKWRTCWLGMASWDPETVMWLGYSLSHGL